MEKIKNKFIIYKTLRAYEEAYNREDINDDSIVFVIEDHSIHTHGHTFGDGYDHNKGFFDSVDKLPKGEAGDWAGVMEDGEWYIYYYNVPSGWTNGGKYNISTLTPDILNQYIKKTNIRDYLKDIYNNVYVRKDEVYTPDQDWPTEYDESKNWRWDEEGNLYLIDTELDTESENAVSNKVISRALNTKVDINNYRNDTRNINSQIESLSNSLNTLIG